MSEKLSLCPLCGDAADVLSGMGEFWVRCSDSDCFCSGPMRNQEHNAIAAWNRRASDSSALDKEVNAMRPKWGNLKSRGFWTFRIELERPDGNRVRQDWRVDPVSLENSYAKPKVVLFDEAGPVLQNVIHLGLEGPALPQDAAEKPAKEKKA